jgi:hypothetical protein
MHNGKWSAAKAMASWTILCLTMKSYMLTNLNGQVIEKIKGPAHVLQFDVEQKGTYILHVKAADKLTQLKAIVMK